MLILVNNLCTVKPFTMSPLIKLGESQENSDVKSIFDQLIYQENNQV